jgi:hypothetical protein
MRLAKNCTNWTTEDFVQHLGERKKQAVKVFDRINICSYTNHKVQLSLLVITVTTNFQYRFTLLSFPSRVGN